MTNPKKTFICLVVDRSQSMKSMQHDAQDGINNFIKKNKTAPGDCTFSLYQFDDRFERVFGPSNIEMMGTYVLTPRGNTALLDAQWRAINETGEWLNQLPERERPGKVIFLTVTDGEENSSTLLQGYQGREQLRDKVRMQENIYKWDFAYIGADQDAFTVGESMGYTTSMSFASTGASASSMYGNLTDTVLRSRAKGINLNAAGLAGSVDEQGNLTPRQDTTQKPQQMAASSTSSSEQEKNKKK